MAARTAPVLVIAALVLVPLCTIAQEASPQVVAIPNGGFEEGLNQWKIAESDSGRANFTALEQAGHDHPIEQVGAKLRAMMPWISAGKTKVADASGGQG